MELLPCPSLFSRRYLGGDAWRLARRLVRRPGCLPMSVAVARMGVL
jgi:hypothetical protein